MAPRAIQQIFQSCENRTECKEEAGGFADISKRLGALAKESKGSSSEEEEGSLNSAHKGMSIFISAQQIYNEVITDLLSEK